ncbi:MAG: hypothetical protein NUW01_09570 [Gemmatimonadaceae bacterium]|nr:hypothetical protein [Gemmatimonadaceae bacterium]
MATKKVAQPIVEMVARGETAAATGAATATSGGARAAGVTACATMRGEAEVTGLGNRSAEQWEREARAAVNALATADLPRRHPAAVEAVGIALDVILGRTVAPDRLDALTELAELARGQVKDNWTRSVRTIAREIGLRVGRECQHLRKKAEDLDATDRAALAAYAGPLLCRVLRKRLGPDFAQLTPGHCSDVLAKYSARAKRNRLTIAGMVVQLLEVAHPWPELRERDDLLKDVSRALRQKKRQKK